MKNINALQVAVILFLIIIIGLIVGLVFALQGNTEREEARKKAVSDLKAAQTAQAAAEANVATLREYIGIREGLDMAQIQEVLNNDMKFVFTTLGKAADDLAKAKNTEIANYVTVNQSKNYRAALESLKRELVKRNEELVTVVSEKQALESALENRQLQHDTIVAAVGDSLVKAKTEYLDETKQLSDTNAANKALWDKNIAEKDLAIETAKKEAAASQDFAVKTRNEKAQTDQKNEQLTEQLADIRREVVDRPDAKILSVNQYDRTVVLNVGKEDGVRTGMTMSVYHPNVTGLTYGTTDSIDMNLLCPICKSNHINTLAKASIEVIELLADPHKSRARIKDDALIDPIVPGDVAHTPLWTPGQIQRFALSANLRLPGSDDFNPADAAIDLDMIMRKIRESGAEVDAYVSVGDDEHEHGEIVGAITQQTNYLVLGDITNAAADPAYMGAQSKLLDEARTMAVEKISLSQLLSMIGWTNMGQTQRFGDNNHATELRMPGQWGGESTGVATQLFMRDPQSGIRLEDYPNRRSTGTASDRYNGNAPSRSTGGVSDLFRTRQPGATSSAVE